MDNKLNEKHVVMNKEMKSFDHNTREMNESFVVYKRLSLPIKIHPVIVPINVYFNILKWALMIYNVDHVPPDETNAFGYHSPCIHCRLLHIALFYDNIHGGK